VCPHAQHDRIGMHDVGSNVTAGPTSALATPIPPTTITKFRHWVVSQHILSLLETIMLETAGQHKEACGLHEHVLRKRI
jgi:hypothetical protein